MRLRCTLGATRRQLQALRNRASCEAGAQQTAIFDAQAVMLMLAWRGVLWRAGEQAGVVLSSLPDEYLGTRAVDARGVVSRAVAMLEGRSGHPLVGLLQPQVVASEELVASDTAQMDQGKGLGFVMGVGTAVNVRLLWAGRWGGHTCHGRTNGGL